MVNDTILDSPQPTGNGHFHSFYIFSTLMASLRGFGVDSELELFTGRHSRDNNTGNTLIQWGRGDSSIEGTTTSTTRSQAVYPLTLILHL